MPPISSGVPAIEQSQDNTDPYPVERDGPALRVALEEEECRSRDASENCPPVVVFREEMAEMAIATAMIAAVFSQSVLLTGGVSSNSGRHAFGNYSTFPGAAKMEVHPSPPPVSPVRLFRCCSYRLLLIVKASMQGYRPRDSVPL